MTPPVRGTDMPGTPYYSGVDASDTTETIGPQGTMAPAADRAETEAAEVIPDIGKGASTLSRAPIGDPIASSAMQANLSAMSAGYSASTDSNIGFAKTPPQGGAPPNAGGKPTGGSDTDARNFDAAKADRERVANYKMPVGPKLPTDGQAVSADAALDMLEKDPDLIAHSMSHEFHRDVWQNSLGMKGEPPVAYKVGNGVRIDYERLTPAQKQRYKTLVEAQEKAKWARTAKGTGASGKGEADAARHTKQGVGVDNKPGKSTAVTGAGENTVVDGTKKGGVPTEKGMGVGRDTVVDAGKKGTVATERGMGVAGKGAGTAEKAVDAAKGIGTGTKIGVGVAKVATTVADILMPGPQDAIFMILGAFMATVDWKDKAVQQNTEQGFAVGMAAALVGASPEYLKSVHDKQPGIREGHEAYDKALQAGYDYVQSLPPEKRKALHDAAFKQLAADGRTWTPHQDDPNKSKAANQQIANEDLGELAWMVGGTLGPTVKQRFEEVAEQRRQQEEQKQKAYAPHGEHGNKV